MLHEVSLLSSGLLIVFKCLVHRQIKCTINVNKRDDWKANDSSLHTSSALIETGFVKIKKKNRLL